MKKRDKVRVPHEKKSDGVTVALKKKRAWMRVEHEKKSDGVRVHHEKEG